MVAQTQVVKWGMSGRYEEAAGWLVAPDRKTAPVQKMPIVSDPGLNKLLLTTSIDPKIVVELGPMLRASFLGRKSSVGRFTVAEAQCSMPQSRRTSCQEYRSS